MFSLVVIAKINYFLTLQTLYPISLNNYKTHFNLSLIKVFKNILQLPRSSIIYQWTSVSKKNLVPIVRIKFSDQSVFFIRLVIRFLFFFCYKKIGSMKSEWSVQMFFFIYFTIQLPERPTVAETNLEVMRHSSENRTLNWAKSSLFTGFPNRNHQTFFCYHGKNKRHFGLVNPIRTAYCECESGVNLEVDLFQLSKWRFKRQNFIRCSQYLCDSHFEWV